MSVLVIGADAAAVRRAAERICADTGTRLLELDEFCAFRLGRPAAFVIKKLGADYYRTALLESLAAATDFCGATVCATSALLTAEEDAPWQQWEIALITSTSAETCAALEAASRRAPALYKGKKCLVRKRLAELRRQAKYIIAADKLAAEEGK